MIELLYALLFIIALGVIFIGRMLFRLAERMDYSFSVGMDLGLADAIRVLANQLVSMDAELARCAEALEDTLPARLDQIVAAQRCAVDRITKADLVDIYVPPSLVLLGESSFQAVKRIVREAEERRRAQREERRS